MRRSRILLIAAGLALPLAATATWAGPAQDAVLAHYAALAKAADANFAGFSAERGRQFFLATHQGGHPETPSCTSCHTSSISASGKTRAGKAIAPMALSVSPDRYSDLKKVEKWLRRNCNSVLGRACTPQEAGDVLTFYMSQ